MSEQPTRAVVVHAIAGRARLRIDERRDDEGFFAALAERLSQHPAVREVRANASAASLLILHEGDLQSITEFAQQRGLFDVAAPAARSSMRNLQAVIEGLDARIASETGDAASLGKLAFVALVGAGLWQAKQGKFLPAGVTLFNYALGVMGWVTNRESTGYPQNYPHRS